MESRKQKASRPVDLPTSINGKAHRKENYFYKEYIGVIIRPKKDPNRGRLHTVINCRLYSTGTRIYCCLWVDTGNGWGKIGGSGFAGGYGYHKASAAVSEAITAAGYTLTRDIDGVGDTAILEALEAIGKLHGYKNMEIIESHG